METKRPWNWKGDLAGYQAKHRWMINHFGKPQECEKCHKICTGRGIHWANISGKYLRERTDWKRLCARCHSLEDKNWLNRKTSKPLTIEEILQIPKLALTKTFIQIAEHFDTSDTTISSWVKRLEKRGYKINRLFAKR